MLTTKEDWDEFFTNRHAGDPFEWLADWPQLERVLVECLSSLTLPENLWADLPILVPACGSSMLSENLYDAGFLKITNVDFSSVVITNMLSTHVYERPKMTWRVMDMTKMDISDGEYGAIVDKGGLTTLMEHQNGLRLCDLYIYEVKRILKTGGKFICVTSSETRVLELLFHSFRFGWKTSVHGIAQDQSSTKPEKKAFVIVAEKQKLPDTVSQISSFCQDRNLHDALGREKKARDEYINGAVVAYTLEDLKQGAKGILSMYVCGRLIKLVLADPAISRASYSAVLLDSKQDSGFVIHDFAVYIVRQLGFSSWLSTSEEGQWSVVANCKAARLLMVFLDPTNSNASMDDVNADILHLAKYLAPGYVDRHHALQVSLLSAIDEVKRNTLDKFTSESSGELLVEEVTYPAVQDTKFRSLTFIRNGSLLTYETSLSRKKSTEAEKPTEQKASSGEFEFDHNFLSCEYHIGVYIGMLLRKALGKKALGQSSVGDNMSKVLVFGLGAGLLPMFMKTEEPTSYKIKVVESDSVILKVARDWFAFNEDAFEVVKKADYKLTEVFDIIVVDMINEEPRYGTGDFLKSAHESLSHDGIFIFHVMVGHDRKSQSMILEFKEIFKSIAFISPRDDGYYIMFGFKRKSMTEDRLQTAKKLVMGFLNGRLWNAHKLAGAIKHKKDLKLPFVDELIDLMQGLRSSKTASTQERNPTWL